MWEKLHARVALVLIILCTGALLLRYPAKYGNFGSIPPKEFMTTLHAREWVARQISPYRINDLSPYRYAPGFLALVDVLPRKPSEAWRVFSTLSILALGVSLLIGGRYRSWKSIGWLVLGLILSWKGIVETLDCGELELLILALAVGAAALRLRYPVLAGFLAGTLPWLKFPWILLLLPLILVPLGSLIGPGKRPKRVRLLISGYFFSWFVWGVAVPTLVFGTERATTLTRDWIELLISKPQAVYYSNINQSAWISALRWFGGNENLAFAVVAIMGGYIIGCLTVRNLKITPNREVFEWLSPWLILTQLLNPVSWRWGSVFLVGLPFSIAVISASRGKTLWRSFLVLAAAFFWLLQLNPVVKLFGYHHWSDIHGYGILTTYWLVLLFLCLDTPAYWAGAAED